jgi:hypothetical protein
MRGGLLKMRSAITIMVIALVASMACTCLAGVNQAVKVAVHVRAHNAKLGCDPGTIETCADIVTTYEGFSFDAFPIFYDLTEFKGCQYGLTWPAWSYSAAFTSCSDLVIDAVTWPGEGAAHSWLACQPEAVCVPSFIWLYAETPGQVCVVNYPDSDPPGLYLLDCSEGLDWPTPCVYCAGVYGATGGDPCATCQPATEAATWSSIKKIFK